MIIYRARQCHKGKRPGIGSADAVSDCAQGGLKFAFHVLGGGDAFCVGFDFFARLDERKDGW